MMNAELLKEIKAYLKPARKRLVCSKKSKDDFYRDILASAEEYLQLHPNASKRELCEYLGDCEALASGFMDSLPKREIIWARRKSKLLLAGGIILAALSVMVVFYLIVVHETTGIQFIYQY